MKSLFVRTLIAFLIALIIFLGIMSSFFLLGYHKSLNEWTKKRLKHVEEYALLILEGHLKNGKTTYTLLENLPFFVYNSEKNLIFSNRGAGLRRQNPDEKDELQPIIRNGKVSGYFYAGALRFREDTANNQFLESMTKTIWIAVPFSFILACIFALFYSKNLSKQAKAVAHGLDEMAGGQLSANLPEGGIKELAGIARSANSLGKQLKREEKIRCQWAQDIAHDLRTPVSALMAQLEAMKDGVLEINRARIEKSIIELSRIGRLVNDLDELTRLESPEMRLLIVPVDTQSFIEGIKDRFTHDLKEKDIKLKLYIEDDSFSADEDLLLRAVSNIMTNALRHTPFQGRIEIQVKQEQDESLIRIFNSGIPISDNESEIVFDRLYRGEYARKTPGSGLGLTIAKKIVELHRGSISIKGEKDGTTVEISLSK